MIWFATIVIKRKHIEYTNQEDQILAHVLKFKTWILLNPLKNVKQFRLAMFYILNFLSNRIILLGI